MSTDEHLPGNLDYEDSDNAWQGENLETLDAMGRFEGVRSAVQGITRELRITNQIFYFDKLGETASDKERKEITKDIRRGLGLIDWLRPGDPGYEEQPRV